MVNSHILYYNSIDQGGTTMKNDMLTAAIDKLAEWFRNLKWDYLDVPAGSSREKTQLWPGEPDEEIMICLHKGTDIHELFHRQDYYFVNFAYKGDYGAISYKFDNRVTIREGECYISQPFAGYALDGHNDDEIIIIGVLIQKEAFYKSFWHILSADTHLFHFFLEPQANKYADEFIHLRFEDVFFIRNLLELMVIEYANKQNTTQDILKPMTLTLLMQIARQYKLSTLIAKNETMSDKIIRYMSEHIDTVTLKDIAAEFSYHPNYISTLIHKEMGKTFSQVQLEQRMSRSASLLKGTNLSVEEVAYMVGYSNSSNFFKAFKDFYGCSPREYA